MIAAHSRDDPRAVGRAGNREWHLVITNPTLASRLRNHLLADFDLAQKLGGMPELAASDVLVDVADVPAEGEVELETPMRDVLEAMTLSRRFRIRPLLTPDLGGKVFADAVMELIESAENYILLQNQYINIIGARAGALDKIVDVLVRKSESVDVRIILRSGITGLRENLEHLKRCGLDVARTVRCLARTHTKGVVIDGRRVLIGSQNWSAPGVSLNRDASLIVEDPDVATYYEQAFDMDWDRARPPRFVEAQAPDVRLAIGPAAPEGFRRMRLSEYVEG